MGETKILKVSSDSSKIYNYLNDSPLLNGIPERIYAKTEGNDGLQFPVKKFVNKLNLIDRTRNNTYFAYFKI